MAAGAAGLARALPFPTCFTARLFICRMRKGANSGDLPAEQSLKFEVVINPRTGTALRLTSPRALLRADEVIE